MDEEDPSAVTAVVKWFNPHKRYGFVHIPERNQDAFMHASVLSMDEEEWPREDDEIVCTLDEDGRGLKVTQVLRMSRAEAQPRTHGAIRWFDRRKGYGFIITESGADIFVHRSALGQIHEEEMEPGRFVTFRARDGKKGKAAVDVELDADPPADVVSQINQRLAAQDGGDPGDPGAPGGADEPEAAGEPGAPGGADEPEAAGDPEAPGGADEPEAAGDPGAPGGADEPEAAGDPGAPGGADEPEAAGEPGAPGGADEPSRAE